MKRKSVWLAVLVALSPAVLLAADPSGPAPGAGREAEMFKKLDKNQDGVITKDEAQAAGAERIARSFDSLDLDHDGMITQDELHAAHEARREEMKQQFAARFKQADKNGDGFLSKDEAAAGMPRLAARFDQLDTNKDGLVSPEELAASRHHFGKGPGGWHRGPQGGPPQGDPAQR